MRDLSTLSDIVARIFEATVCPSAWDDVCDRIVDHLGATAFMVYEYDLTAHRSPKFFGSEITRDAGAPLVQALCEGGADEDQAAYAQAAHISPCALVPEYQLFHVDHDLDMPENNFRAAVLRAGNSRSRSVARLNEIGPWMDLIGLHMPCFGADIEAKTFSDMDFILPVVGKALETGRLVRNLSYQFGMLLDAFDMFDFPAAFCAPNGRLLVANQRMRESLQDGDAVQLSGSELVTASYPASRRKLQTVLSAAALPDTPPSGLWLQLGRRSGRPPFVAKAAPVRVKELDARDTQPVLLILADPEDVGRVHTEGLAAFGLLTPAELDVCRWLLRGTDTAEIAERRSASPETIRSQIKSASSKLACNSRLDLLRVALATSLPSLAPEPTEKPPIS